MLLFDAINDPVLKLLATCMSQAAVYSGFMALCKVVINSIVSAFSGNGLKID